MRSLFVQATQPELDATADTNRHKQTQTTLLSGAGVKGFPAVDMLNGFLDCTAQDLVDHPALAAHPK
ncbi:MAG: hypothetical protein COA37_09645 [Hoeflea sp.]|nr:MAG: hypothetical protein COA37_09645 [Hoeflea sp.]